MRQFMNTMSISNLTNNIMQPQNIVINQVPLSHAIMTNVNHNNGMPIATALAHTSQTMEHHQPTSDMKSNMVVDSLPMAGSSLVGVQQNIPIQNSNVNQMKLSQNLTSMPIEPAQVLSKQRLQDLVRDTDSTLNLEDEVEEIILNYVDEFVDRCLNGAALIAKNRHVNSIEVKDIQQFLNRNYNMWTPGFGTDELRPYKRSFTTEAHKQRLALIRKTLKKY